MCKILAKGHFQESKLQSRDLTVTTVVVMKCVLSSFCVVFYKDYTSMIFFDFCCSNIGNNTHQLKFEVFDRRKTKTGSGMYFVVVVFTSPAGAVVKYCDELVCLSVCLSVPV